MLYADRKFFERFDQQVYVSCPGVPQPGLGAPRYTMKHEDGSKDIIAQFGSGIFIEERGVLAIEAEYALENSHNACLTPSRDDASLLWSHLQAETSGIMGLAMHVAPSGLLWEDPHLAPAMNYRIRIQTPGRYRVRLLVLALQRPLRLLLSSPERQGPASLRAAGQGQIAYVQHGLYVLLVLALRTEHRCRRSSLLHHREKVLSCGSTASI